MACLFPFNCGLLTAQRPPSPALCFLFNRLFRFWCWRLCCWLWCRNRFWRCRLWCRNRFWPGFWCCRLRRCFRGLRGHRLNRGGFHRRSIGCGCLGFRRLGCRCFWLWLGPCALWLWLFFGLCVSGARLSCILVRRFCRLGFARAARPGRFGLGLGRLLGRFLLGWRVRGCSSFYRLRCLGIGVHRRPCFCAGLWLAARPTAGCRFFLGRFGCIRWRLLSLGGWVGRCCGGRVSRIVAVSLGRVVLVIPVLLIAVLLSRA